VVAEESESEEESTDDDQTTQPLDVVDHGWGFIFHKTIQSTHYKEVRRLSMYAGEHFLKIGV
jgi:hypothetical protein